KVKISKNFEKVNEKQLEQHLSVITKFRNVCAHNERLYSYKTKNDIPSTDIHKKLGIQKNGSQYVFGKHDLFSVVISFRYLLSDEDFKKFKSSLSRILKRYVDSTNAMTETDLYKYMGFPINWKKISTYKK
ncbi:MAG: Abi family protein, partial [Clostridia bacterium]|nr:Abi family protein [Clostridia bacterium]